MQALNYEQQTLDEVVQTIPVAGSVLRSNDVVSTARNNWLSLSQAAQLVSTTTDELLAVMEYRTRRAAKRNR
jgi:hypothetical protein